MISMYYASKALLCIMHISFGLLSKEKLVNHRIGSALVFSIQCNPYHLDLNHWEFFA